MRAALAQTPRADPVLHTRMDSVSRSLASLELRLSGHPEHQRLSEAEEPPINERLGMVIYGHWETRQMPTATMRRDLTLAAGALQTLTRELEGLLSGDFARLEADVAAAGAPWTPGRRPT
jgi:hypothetical protein